MDRVFTDKKKLSKAVHQVEFCGPSRVLLLTLVEDEKERKGWNQWAWEYVMDPSMAFSWKEVANSDGLCLYERRWMGGLSEQIQVVMEVYEEVMDEVKDITSSSRDPEWIHSFLSLEMKGMLKRVQEGVEELEQEVKRLEREKGED